MSQKEKIEEARALLRDAKKVVIELMDEPLSEKQKRMVLELYRILR